MKALILNSGMGSRMGVLASEHPKCMTEIDSKDTILSRQLRQISEAGIEEVIMTTGNFDTVLVNYCQELSLPIKITFVKNPLYKETNYIYSIYCAREYLDDDIILMHGDLVFEHSVFDSLMAFDGSCMIVSSTLPLPQKDFKAVLNNDKIVKVGIEFFNEAVAAQPLYKLTKDDMRIWLDEMIQYCEADNTGCYAENALNEVAESMNIRPLDVKKKL
ncbi:MAG: NTP transferase domain-containing protein, partial [Lachnospiraceae bacterium]|nr:NTP transferase domain-containing protein [Lachnospiraceae bacterium]